MPKIIKKRTEKDVRRDENMNETVTDIRQRLKKNQRMLVRALTAFIVLLVIVIGFIVYNTASKNKALEAELEGYKLFYGDLQAQLMPPAERYKKALEMFKKSYASKKRPHVLLYIANSNYELGNYDEAIKTLRELNSQYSDPKILSLSYYKMAMSYAKKGDNDNAVASFKSLLSIKDGSLQDMALFESARILEAHGKSEEAKARYKELADKFPKSVLVTEAKIKLEKK
jgi:predicted negative regulator of RcsB-dependent stress response